MKTNKKKLATGIAVVGIGLASFGGGALANNFWAGHTNIVAINNDIDILQTRIKDKDTQIKQLKDIVSQCKTELGIEQGKVKDLEDKLKQQQTAYQQLAAAKDANDQANAVKLQDQINKTQQAIVDGQAKVNDKQAELDKANQNLADANAKNKDLQGQLDNANSDLGKKDTDLAQALQDVRNTQAKADQAVEATK